MVKVRLLAIADPGYVHEDSGGQAPDTIIKLS